MVFLPFILRRARRHWQIVLTLFMGVLLATALLASGPLLVDTVIQFGLRRTLISSEPLQSHLRIKTRATTDPVDYYARDERLQATFQERFGGYLARVVRSASSRWMYPWVDGQLVPDQRVNLCFYDDIENQIEFIAGNWPDALANLSLTNSTLPAVISEEMAQAYTLRVGDRLPFSFRSESDAPDTSIQVSGIVRPQNARDPYWFGDLSPLTSQDTQRWTAQYSVFLSDESFFTAIAALFPESNTDVVWQVLLSPEKIKTRDIAPLREQLAGLIAELHTLETRIVLESGLDDILADYDTQAQAIRAPLYILTAEVVLLALYYVTMVAALSVREAEREFAVLRSRGASGWQILKIQLTEAGLIGVVAFVGGPVLGGLLVRWLTWAGPLADVAQAGWGLGLDQSAWLGAGVGAVSCLVGLALPIGPALRRSIVAHQQMLARPARPPWWQRLYLDVFLLLAGLALLWRLHLYGDLVINGGGQSRLDWLLLLSPLALLLGTATILLRVFPLALRALAALAARARGLSGVLAMWQAARDPTHVARLVLLLTLSIALGILSTGLNATLDQSEFERSRYVAGSDIRLASNRYIPVPDLQSAPGVRELTGAWRGTGSVDLKSDRVYPRFEVLAIEPFSFAEVTVYRDDFSDQYMGQLLGYLEADTSQKPPMLALPGQPARLGMWMRATMTDEQVGGYREYAEGDSDADRVGVEAKLQTAQGEMLTVKFRQVELVTDTATQIDRFVLRLNPGGLETQLQFQIEPVDDGWRYFETTLPALPVSSYPVSLHSLWLSNQARMLGDRVAMGLHLSIDDVVVVDAETGESVLAGGFEDPTQIWFLDDDASVARLTKSTPHSGEWVLALDLNYAAAIQVTGLKLTKGSKSAPLPAIVSPAFLATTELRVGDLMHGWIESLPLDFEIVGTVRYFPTLFDEMEAGFMITSRDALLPFLNISSPDFVNLNEVLIESGGKSSADSLAERVPDLAHSWEAETVRKDYKANPLTLGLRSVTFFGYVLTTLLSLVGFATHFYMSARQRETVYGVIRAMGLSPRQLYGSLVLEQVVLILAGLALGTLLGLLLNQITLPRLPITLGGDRPPVPPFYPRSDWLAVGRIYVVLTFTFLVTLGLATVLLWRARVHRILRIGQE